MPTIKFELSLWEASRCGFVILATSMIIMENWFPICWVDSLTRINRSSRLHYRPLSKLGDRLKLKERRISGRTNSSPLMPSGLGKVSLSICQWHFLWKEDHHWEAGFSFEAMWESSGAHYTDRFGTLRSRTVFEHATWQYTGQFTLRIT